MRIGEPEHIGRVDIHPAIVVAPTRSSPCFIGRMAITIVEIGLRSEIERLVGVEDLQTAHQEHEQNDDIGHAHGARMAIDNLLSASRMRPRL